MLTPADGVQTFAFDSLIAEAHEAVFSVAADCPRQTLEALRNLVLLLGEVQVAYAPVDLSSN